MVFTCTYNGCGKIFTRIGHLQRHLDGHIKEKKFVCSKCLKRFSRFGNRNRHEVNCTGEQQPSGSGLNRKTAPVPPTINHSSSIGSGLTSANKLNILKHR